MADLWYLTQHLLGQACREVQHGGHTRQLEEDTRSTTMSRQLVLSGRAVVPDSKQSWPPAPWHSERLEGWGAHFRDDQAVASRDREGVEEGQSVLCLVHLDRRRIACQSNPAAVGGALSSRALPRSAPQRPQAPGEAAPGSPCARRSRPESEQERQCGPRRILRKMLFWS